MMVMSLEIVSVLASIREPACEISTPNFVRKTFGSTFVSRSENNYYFSVRASVTDSPVIALFSAMFLRFRRRVGPRTVATAAKVRNLPCMAPTYLDPYLEPGK